jgi:hypothetical protein
MADLKISLGVVNYVNYLRVTASKVSSPSAIAYQTYITVPVTNYNFIIPGLDPEIYFIRYYDAPTNVSLGTLVAELVVNALTGEFMYERRFYTVAGPGMYDPANGALLISDPYLINKKVVGFFKEAFRYYEPLTEFSTDPLTGIVNILTGVPLSSGEKVTLEIQYAVANNTSTASVGLYNANLDIPEQNRVLTTAELNTRLRMVGTAATQIVTLPALSSFANNNGYYFDNSVGGTAVQIKILLNGVDKIRFNGFSLLTTLFTEFWVSRGDHLLIRKFDNTYWEVITDYKGTNVGEKVSMGFVSHPNILAENGQLVDGDEYPRLWWWISNVLPGTHKYVTATVNGSFVADAARVGQFAVHPSLKLFRMPLTMGMMEKGLTDFNNYGLDIGNRAVDYPGGFQNELVKDHDHTAQVNENGTGDSLGVPFSKPAITDNNNIPRGTMRTNGTIKTDGSTNSGVENRTKNIGVIFGRRI